MKYRQLSDRGASDLNPYPESPPFWLAGISRTCRWATARYATMPYAVCIYASMYACMALQPTVDSRHSKPRICWQDHISCAIVKLYLHHSPAAFPAWRVSSLFVGQCYRSCALPQTAPPDGCACLEFTLTASEPAVKKPFHMQEKILLSMLG